RATRSGAIVGVNAREIGQVVSSLGGGRVRVEDAIDPFVGFMAEAGIGDEIREGDAIGLLYCRDHGEGLDAANRVLSAYELGAGPPATAPKLIKEVIAE